MSFSIRLTDTERAVAESYAKLHALSRAEAFKRALFEKIEDEYDIALADEAYDLRHRERAARHPRPRPRAQARGALTCGREWKDLPHTPLPRRSQTQKTSILLAFSSVPKVY